MRKENKMSLSISAQKQYQLRKKIFLSPLTVFRTNCMGKPLISQNIKKDFVGVKLSFAFDFQKNNILGGKNENK